ncbi:hypothetical protein [Candidatus Pantoea formicae]|uniref:hypothetical protein n=1 Tax=Candidatus Pantoea formicae TaxID=2608355 RepID=UPI003EDAFF67
MNNLSVKGAFTLIPNEKSNNKVLYLPFNRSHFELALIIAESSQYKSYLYAENFEVLAREYLNTNPNSKISFILDRDSVAGLLPNMRKLVVFLGYVVPFIPTNINEIVTACLKVKIPIYELPHGMFQTGINITDDSKLISTRSHYFGFGQSLPSISNFKLQWFGEEGFGYPRTVKKTSYKKRQLPKFTLVTSNTNWYLYSHKDKRVFYTEVFKYAKNNPSEVFIWCVHPAELSENSFSFNALNFRPKNVYLYGIDKDIYFDGINGTDDLIPYCEYGISTVTTCLLDYEIHAKKVNIFNSLGVDSLTATLSEKHLFTLSSEIRNDACNIKTGFLKEFDAIYFDQLLANENIIDDELNHNYLSSFMPVNIQN